MKKLICCLLVLSMLVPILGCSENEVGSDGTSGAEKPVAEYTVYDKPTFTPGTLESDLLTVQTGNFDRTSRTGGLRFLEIGSGYYYVDYSGTFYADRSDMTNWVRFCNDPDCGHSGDHCTSNLGGIYLNSKGRICVVVSCRPTYSYLAGSNANNSDYMLISMDTTGGDLRLENLMVGARINGGSGASQSAPALNGYALNILSLNLDGEYDFEIYIWDERYGELHLPAPQSNSVSYARGVNEDSLGMFGDTAYAFANGALLWYNGSEMVQTDVLQFPTFGSHLSGNTVRFYRTNDGYYDYDLLTGEETRIADAQVDDAAAWIIEPNCILETTLFDSSDADDRAAVRTHTMKLFDGQTWHEVTLPEEIASGKIKVEFTALTSDSIILTHEVESTRTEPGFTTFYRIALGQDTYTLEQIGQFTAE